MCRKHLFDREIVQLLENEPPSDFEDDLESGDEHGIYNRCAKSYSLVVA
jgi:hypothetical protein